LLWRANWDFTLMTFFSVPSFSILFHASFYLQYDHSTINCRQKIEQK